MLPEGVESSKGAEEMANRELWERMRTRRFKTNPRMAEWNDEFKGFKESDGQSEAYPLIFATKHALAQIEYAIRQAPKTSKPAYPRVSMI